MRTKLFLSFILIIVVTVSLVAALVRWGAVNEVRQYMVRGGMLGLTELAHSLEEYYRSNGTWQGVNQLLNISHGAGPGMGGMMNQRLILADPSGIIVDDTRDVDIGKKLDKSQLVTAVPLTLNGQVVGYVLAVGGMGFASTNEQQLYTRLNRAAVIAGLVAGGLGFLLALILAYTLLRPVRDLTLASQKLAEGDLSQRVQVQGNDEMATLGRTFNRMADSLQQSETSRRAMTADIAHELRTPLAVQRANLEALQDGIYPLTIENLNPVVEQNHLLTHLVEDLRTLALADAGQIRLELAPTDLPSLTARVVDKFQPQATSQQVNLVFSSQAAQLPLIRIDPLRMEQLLTNLLSNALRYTPPGGNIDVEIVSLPSAAQLTVHDSGPGIPEDALPFIFERFYRVDKARSRSEGGSGLGLAIARNLARAHGGELTATNHASGGALFTLILPDSSPAPSAPSSPAE